MSEELKLPTTFEETIDFIYEAQNMADATERASVLWSALNRTPAQGWDAKEAYELETRLRKTAADMVDFNGKTMREWDEIRAKCLTHKGSDLPRLMFEALLESFSDLMLEAADMLHRPPAEGARTKDEP